jgi:ABC-type sugar transport system ATPase subunit
MGLNSVTGTASTPLLEMEGVSKSYDGVQALRAADLDVLPGEIHGLLGENGAGKSTLMKILVGAVQRDDGTIRINGEPVEIRSRQDAQALGLGIVFQHPELVEELSIVDNVTLGRERARAGFVDRQEGAERTRSALRRLGVALEPERSAAGLRAGERQLVEIARAIAYDLRVLVLDEPTASLGSNEVDDLFRVVRELRDSGVAIVYISHRLEEVFRLVDRITVLRDGAVVGTVDVATATHSDVVGMMVGRSMGHAFRKMSHATDRVVLDADGLETAEGVRNVSLRLHEGEVLGVYGLLGSGRTELARALYGADRLLSGQIAINGRPLRRRSPSHAVRRGLGLVPEDRTHQGALLELSVTENVTLARAERLARGFFVRHGEERKQARDVVDALAIRTASVDSLVSTLSGGNQQKVVFGRWLVAGARILLLDDPTVGVDVGAKEEIYRIIAELTGDGTSVIFLSSELPEVIGLADRMLILREGAVAGDLAGDEMTESRALALALGEAA